MDGLKALADAGVKTVIDLQGGDGSIPLLGKLIQIFEPGESAKQIKQEQLEVESLGMTFRGTPLDSLFDINRKEGDAIEATLAYMNEASNGPIYVHCAHGNDRTGLVIALYRVRYDHFNVQQAHNEMVEMGHKGFIDHIVTHSMDEYFYERGPELQSLADPGANQ